MSTSMANIASAFHGGSGIEAVSLAIIGAIGMTVIIVGIAITALFRRLKLFERDNDAQGMMRDAIFAFFTIFIVLLVISIMVAW